MSSAFRAIDPQKTIQELAAAGGFLTASQCDHRWRTAKSRPVRWGEYQGYLRTGTWLPQHCRHPTSALQPCGPSVEQCLSADAESASTAAGTAIRKWLMMSGKPHLRVRQRTLVVVVIIALGLTLTFILFQARVLNQTTRQGEFSQRAALGATALQRSMQEHLEVLWSCGLYASCSASQSQPRGLSRIDERAFETLSRCAVARMDSTRLGSRARSLPGSRTQDGMATFTLLSGHQRCKWCVQHGAICIIPSFTSSPWSSIGPLWVLILAQSPRIWKPCKRRSVPGAVASAWRSLAHSLGSNSAFSCLSHLQKRGTPSHV